jgi:TonB family protein
VNLVSIEGKYEILGKLREGGMGAVYKVRHRLLDEVRVIKVIRPHLVAPELSDRFLHEARLAIQLRHPNIAQLHDFSVDEDGSAYIVMEFIDGATLDDLVKVTGPPPLGLGLEIAQQSLRALGYLHRKGFVHRDIAPDNLMLTRDVDGAPLVKLIDLGIAKVLKGGAGLTVAGTFLGKPRYASPEQFGAEGEAGMDARSDLYSFGVVLYELLTGSHPIPGRDPSSFMAGHLFRPPLGFSESDPEGRLPADLREILSQALAKKPEERPASAEELARRLAEVQTRFPVAPGDLDRALRQVDLDGTFVIPAVPGSTQGRLDRKFAKEPTVAPMDETLRIFPAAPPPPPPPEPSPERPRPEASVVAAPAGLPSPLPEPPRRRRTASWEIAAAVLVALLILGGLGWSLRPRPTRRPEPVAVPAPTATPAATTAEVVPAPSPTPAAVPSSSSPVPAPVESPAPAPAMTPAAPPPAETPAVATPPSPRPPRPAERRPVAAATSTAPVRKPPVPSPSVKDGKGVEVPFEPGGEPKGRRGKKDPPMKRGEMILDGPGVENAQPVSSPPPVYPPSLSGSGRYARVVLDVLVDENGAVLKASVNSAFVDDGSADAEFRKAALAAARQARFEPATKDGIPGKMWGTLSYEFGTKKP